MYLVSLIKDLVGGPTLNDTYQSQNNRNVIVIAETGFSHGTQNSSNSGSTLIREQGEQNNFDRTESDTREVQIPSFDQSKHKDITSSSKLVVQNNKSSHVTKIEENNDCYNRLNSNKRYDISQNQIDTIKSLIVNKVQQNDKTSIQIEEKHNSNNCTEHSKNNSRTFRGSNKQPINEKEIKEEEEKIGTKGVRFDLSMQNTYRFQRNEKNETVDLLANQSNRRFVEEAVEAKIDSSSESNNDSKERNQRSNASGQNRGHQNYNRFQRGGRYCNNFQNDRRNDRQQFNNGQTGNWRGDQNNYSRGKGFSNNRQERSDQPDQQRYQYGKGNVQFVDNPNFNHNEESRPNSVQSNYEVRESENAIPERPGSSQSDYQRNNRTNNPTFHSTRRQNFQGRCKSYERVFSPNFNHNNESRPNSVQSNYEEGRSEQNFHCFTKVPNIPGLNQSNYQKTTHIKKPNCHGIRNNARIQDFQGQNNFDERVFPPNFIHKKESRPNSVQSNYEEGRSEQNFYLQVPNRPGLNQSNYQRNTRTNKPNHHGIRNNAKSQDFQMGNDFDERIHYICNSCSQYGNNRGFRADQNRPYNQSTGSSTVHGSHVPKPDNSERQFHGRGRGNGLGGTAKKLSRMRIAKATKTNIAQEINSVNESESKDVSDYESVSDNESDETNAEKDQPFQVSSLDFKDGFPMDEAEAARRNIDLNEEVEDIMLFGKDGEVVVTEQPKTLRDMMIFMQNYPNATAVTIKDEK